MKKESLSTSMPKLVMAVILIVGIGAVLGALGYFGTIEKGEVVINNEVEKEETEKEEDSQRDYYINRNLGIKFDYSSDGFKGKLITQNNQIVYNYSNSNNIEYISLFTKEQDQSIENAILNIIKNEGKDSKNCKVIDKGKYWGNPEYKAYRLELSNPAIIYSEKELERIKLADIEAKRDGDPFDGEYQKQAIRAERLIEACSYYADPLGLGTSSTIPSRFIYNNKNKFVFLPGLAGPSFYQENSIELFDDYYQSAEEKNSDTTDKVCGVMSDFVNYKWFKEMDNAYQNKYLEEYYSYMVEDAGKFYNDYPFNADTYQACLFSNYFIFSPWENISMEGAFYSYDIQNDDIIKSPQNNDYWATGLTELDDDFIFFESGGGSGECFSEKYGKYFFKENKIEIYRECGGCMKPTFTDEDCKDIKIIYQ